MDSRATKRMVMLATLGALAWTATAHAEKFQCGRTGGDFIDPFAQMTRVDSSKFSECIKEVVMARDAHRGDEAAHGKCVH